MNVSRLSSFAKYLDQPLLLEGLEKHVHWLLPTAGVGYATYDTYKAPAGERKKRGIQNFSVMAAAIGAAWWAQGRYGEHEAFNIKAVVGEIKTFLTHRYSNHSLTTLLNKAERKALSPHEVHNLRQSLGQYDSQADLTAMIGQLRQTVSGKSHDRDTLKELKEVLEHLKTTHQLHSASNAPKNPKSFLFKMMIPDPANKSVWESAKEIKNLSLLGLFPILGGIAGGMIGNLINHEPWRKNLSNQTKEGFYQFLSNIFLCNVGALAFLSVLEFPILKKLKSFNMVRLGGMIAGIGLCGVWGGSAIANFLGKNFFNRLCDKGWKQAVHDFKADYAQGGLKGMFRDINKERHPEPVDVMIHMDDLATVGVLAGLKWVGPILPFLYSFSAYRAGIGYRNGKVEIPKASKLFDPAEKRIMRTPAQIAPAFMMQPLQQNGYPTFIGTYPGYAPVQYRPYKLN